MLLVYCYVVPNTMWYRAPAEHWDTQALPIGNSYMGGMFYGGVEREQIQYNEKTLWSGGPDSTDTYAYGNRDGASDSVYQIRKLLDQDIDPRGHLYGLVSGVLDGFGAFQNFGNVFVETGHTNCSDYNRSLDLSRAVGNVHYQCGDIQFNREYFAMHEQNVLVFHYTASQTASLNLLISNVGVHEETSDEAITLQDNIITLRGRLLPGAYLGPEGNLGNNMTYESQIKVITLGGQTEVVDNSIKITGADTVTLILTAGTSYANEYPHYRGIDPHDSVSSRIAFMSNWSFSDMLTRHTEDYQKLYNRVELYLGQDLPEHISTDEQLQNYKNEDDKSLENLLFNYGRYMLISSSLGDTLPANLQGVWNQDNDPQWECDYHFNINAQMDYWPAQVTNLEETIVPLREYLKQLVPAAKETARVIAGVEEGWMIHSKCNTFGFTSPGWSIDWAWEPTSNAFIMQNIWQSYLFNLNETVLRNEIYPLMKGVAEFWTNFLVEYTHSDGKTYLVVSPSFSSEQGPITIGTTFDQQLLRQFYGEFLEAFEVLQIEDDRQLRDLVATQRPRLLPTQISENGTIQEWKDDVQYGDLHHRHCSHLVGLFPGNEINVETPDTFEAARKSLNERGDRETGWSISNKQNLWARLYDGEKAHWLLHSLLVYNIFDNLFDTAPPFQIDGNLGATSGIAEMLLQSHMDYIHLLPALAPIWPSGHFSGLKARGNFEITAHWEDKQLVGLSVLSGSGVACKVKFAQISLTKVFCEDTEVQLEILGEDLVKFSTESGKTYEFRWL